MTCILTLVVAAPGARPGTSAPDVVAVTDTEIVSSTLLDISFPPGGLPTGSDSLLLVTETLMPPGEYLRHDTLCLPPRSS